jgi:integrase
LRHNILIGPEATGELRKLHERQGRPSRGLLFPSPTNPEQPISTSTFAKRWDRIATAAGLKNGPYQFTSHIARHTLASQDQLLQNPERSAKFLGHTVAVYFKDYVDVDNHDNLAPAQVVAGLRAGSHAPGGS